MEQVATSPRKGRLGCTRWLLIGLGTLLGFFATLGGHPWLVEIPVRLAIGWLLHLVVNLPHLRWNPTTLALTLAAAALALVLLHRFVQGITSRTFQPSITLRAAGIFLAATAAAIAMTGIVHELAWLARSPLTHDRAGSDRSETISNGKQLFLALLELDQEGIHPHTVNEVLAHYPGMDDIVTYPATHRHTGHREPFVLFHPGASLSELKPETPLIGALGRVDRRVVVILAGGSAEQVTPQQLEQRLAASP